MTARQVDSRFRGNDDDHDDDDGGEREVPRWVTNEPPSGRVQPAWVTHFLTGLIVTGSIRTALAEAGIGFQTAWALREEEPEFAMYWERALRVHKGVMAGLAMLDAAEFEEASVH